MNERGDDKGGKMPDRIWIGKGSEHWWSSANKIADTEYVAANPPACEGDDKTAALDNAGLKAWCEELQYQLTKSAAEITSLKSQLSAQVEVLACGNCAEMGKRNIYLTDLLRMVDSLNVLHVNGLFERLVSDVAGEPPTLGKSVEKP